MFLLGIALAAEPVTAPPPAVLDAVARTRGAPLAERIDAISGSLLGADYVLDPLGEGSGIDPDPTVRYDAFDCLTYVEEVLALSLAPDVDQAAAIRMALRYEGEVDYAHRKHFMELQWIPDAVRDGWLVDTTGAYGRPVKHLERKVDAATWKAWSGRAKFALTDDQLPMGTMALDVLSLDDAIALAPELRPGTLLLTVRADRSWKPIWISHVGIVVPGEKPTVRHATKMGEGLVRDHGLVWYLEHLKTYDKWPAVGVALLEPVERR
ncbi:MAG: DUF1460 domain-containing protein [Alphaproteobacteria bacterium]|nr:DUF1460 domain-containing protein [Alphaproteobacteria bacterium]